MKISGVNNGILLSAAATATRRKLPRRAATTDASA
jgi:hypothetical protein